jgi:hypothetical protein
MIKIAGSRSRSQQERDELGKFWLPVGVSKTTANKASASRPPPLTVGKRPRPGTPTTDPTKWAKQVKTLPGSQHTRHANAPMATSKGKTRRLMSPSACVNFHPFTETLRQWEEGVPVDCGENWTLDQILAAIQQGPHKSALTPEAITLIEEDVAYQVQAGYAQVVDWEELQRNLPPKLKVSPLAVVPQANRRGRMILDLAFPVLRQEKGKGRKRKGRQEVLQPSVNDTTVRMAPEAPVKELGNVLKRLL